MERFWNIIHYTVFKGEYKLHLLFNRINPFVLVNRVSAVKKFYAKKGVDILKTVDKMYKRPDIGISSIWAGAFMHVLGLLISISVLSVYSAIIQKFIDLMLEYFIIIMLVPYTINHFLLFRHDKYLRYFKEFEKMPKAWKKKWAWVSFFVIAGILFFCIGSFILMTYRINAPMS